MHYPNQHLLCTVEWLQGALDDEQVVVLDLRGGGAPHDYRAGHIPGALPFSLPHLLGLVGGAPGCLVEAAMVRQLEALGVRADQTVVLCDDGYSTALTYLFWAFERVGQSRVRLLAGGLDAWRAAGGALCHLHPRHEPVAYQTTPRDSCLATAPWIAAHAGTIQLLDARGPLEWHAGRIPGAHSCCWTDLVCDEAGQTTLLPAAAIAARLAALPLSPERETVAYCRSGGRASFLYFALRLMGWPRVRTYDGSMIDWLLRDMPVEMGNVLAT